jgi:hypothetical protein
MSAILSVVLNIIVVAYHPSVVAKLVLDGIAILLMCLSAIALTEFRRSRNPNMSPL